MKFPSVWRSVSFPLRCTYTTRAASSRISSIMSPPSVPSTRAGSATGISSSPAAFARWRRACLAWCWSCFSSALMRARRAAERSRSSPGAPAAPRRPLHSPRDCSRRRPRDRPARRRRGGRSKRPGGPRRRPGPRREARPAGRLGGAPASPAARGGANEAPSADALSAFVVRGSVSGPRVSVYCGGALPTSGVWTSGSEGNAAAARWCCLRSTRLTDAALRCSGVMARRRLSERSLSFSLC